VVDAVFVHPLHCRPACMFRVIILPQSMATWIGGGYEGLEAFIRNPLIDVAGHNSIPHAKSVTSKTLRGVGTPLGSPKVK